MFVAFALPTIFPGLDCCETIVPKWLNISPLLTKPQTDFSTLDLSQTKQNKNETNQKQNKKQNKNQKT